MAALQGIDRHVGSGADEVDLGVEVLETGEAPFPPT
jgi:hypothetical protein